MYVLLGESTRVYRRIQCSMLQCEWLRKKQKKKNKKKRVEVEVNEFASHIQLTYRMNTSHNFFHTRQRAATKTSLFLSSNEIEIRDD